MKKKLKVLLLVDSPYFIERDHDFSEEFKQDDWECERQAYEGLCLLGYEVRCLGLFDNITILIDEVKENRPDIIFNMCDVFRQKSDMDKNIAAVLELLGVSYTGAAPGTLFLCNDKALSKKVLSYHRIRVPKFSVFYRKHKVWLPKRFKLPLIVKPLQEEASRGISLASVVDSEESFKERVSFIHGSLNRDAIVEEYIDGREFYIAVFGDRRLKALPPREMKFGQFPEDEPRIATYKAKWDEDYRKKWGIRNEAAGRLSEGMVEKMQEVCKRAYRALNMHSYARFDIRLTPEGKVYIIEANANPSLEILDEVVQSAEKAGILYHKLLEKIVKLALKRV